MNSSSAEFPSTHLSLLRAMMQGDKGDGAPANNENQGERGQDEKREDQVKQEAWFQFSRAYEAAIVEWCIKRGTPAWEASDVAHEILSGLIEGLSSYDSTKGSFRGWLSTVISHAVSSHYRRKNAKKRRIVRPVGGEDHQEVLEQLPSRDATDELATIVDTYVDPLMAKALAKVKERVEELSWRVFEESVMNGRPIVEIADELKITPGAAHMRIHRLKKSVRKEYQKLLNPEDSETPSDEV